MTRISHLWPALLLTLSAHAAMAQSTPSQAPPKLEKIEEVGDDAITVTALRNTRMMFLGGDALEGPRHLWWNFVSSSKERIEQAKEDWKSGRFAHVPDEHEFIPLPG